MKKLMLVVPICLLAVSGLYAQPTSPARVGKGARAAKQAATNVAKQVPAITKAVNAAVEAAEATKEIITQPSGLIREFHNWGSMKNWPEPSTPQPLHWSYYTSGKAEMELPPAVPTVKKTALETLNAMGAKELFEKAPSRAVFVSALEQLGMDYDIMRKMSDVELQELFAAHDILSFAAKSGTASRFEPEEEGVQKTLAQIKWAKSQIDFFDGNYLREPYTEPFNPSAESMRVLMVVFSNEKRMFEMVQKKTHPNITLDFATIENAESMLRHNQYDIVLSGIGTYAFSLSMFAHNLGLDTPVIVYSFAPYWTSPYALYCYNIAGQIPSATSLAEAEGVLNYLSNIVVEKWHETLKF